VGRGASIFYISGCKKLGFTFFGLALSFFAFGDAKNVNTECYIYCEEGPYRTHQYSCTTSKIPTRIIRKRKRIWSLVLWVSHMKTHQTKKRIESVITVKKLSFRRKLVVVMGMHCTSS
jgi:hypothetical protein